MSGVLSYLLNATWQTPVIVLLALVCGRVGRLAPRGLHRLYAAALCAAVGAPALALDGDQLQSLLGLLPRPDPSSSIMATAGSGVLAASSPQETTGLLISAPAALLAFGVVSFFVAAALVRLAWGLHVTRRLLLSAPPVTLGADLERQLAAFCASRGVARPAIRLSSGVDCPVAAGVLTPTILIPPGYLDAERGQVMAGLLHECAHILRRDFSINLALEIVMLPQSWNPALHLLKAAIGRVRESACDAIASDEIGSRTQYASSLVALASSATPRRGHGRALALIRAGELEGRVRRLLEPAICVSRSRRAFAMIATAFGIAVVPFMHVEAATTAAVSPTPAPGPIRTVAMEQLADHSRAPVTAAPPITPEPAHRAASRSRHPAGQDAETTVVLTDAGRKGFSHEWTSASGRHYHVITDNPANLTPDEETRLEGQIDHAIAAVDHARPVLESPAFRAFQERLSHGELQTQIRRATAQLNNPRTQLAIRQAQAFAHSDLARRLGELSDELGSTEFAAPGASPDMSPRVPAAAPETPAPSQLRS